MKKFVIIILCMLSFYSNCKKNPVIPEKSVLQISFKRNNSHVSKIEKNTAPEDKIVITIEPGDKEYEFAFDTGKGVINDISPGTYKVQAYVYDKINRLISLGVERNVKVTSGAKTSISLSLDSYAPESPLIEVGQVTLNWQQYTNESTYNVFRSLRPFSNFQQINDQPIANSSYIDHNVEPGVPYFYTKQATSRLGVLIVESTYCIGASYGWSVIISGVEKKADHFLMNANVNGCGFKNIKKAGLLLAVTFDGQNYSAIPGYGFKDCAAVLYNLEPNYKITFFTNAVNSDGWPLSFDLFDSGYKNDSTQEYIGFVVYQADTITDLGDAFEAMNYIKIFWSGAMGKKATLSTKYVSESKRKRITQSLMRDPQFQKLMQAVDKHHTCQIPVQYGY